MSLLKMHTSKSAHLLLRAPLSFNADRKYEKAAELYSEAIKLHPTAILYANRAMAAIKMESYGLAIADAEAAIEYVE